MTQDNQNQQEKQQQPVHNQKQQPAHNQNTSGIPTRSEYKRPGQNIALDSAQTIMDAIQSEKKE